MTTIPATLSPAQARTLFRAGTITSSAGWATGYAQANLIAVPADWAYDDLLFAQRNPRPCPVLDVTDPGSATTVLAPTADLRTDLPRYQIWEHGQLVDEPADVTDRWLTDLVTFLIGCSFTFETALAQAGVPLRHVEQARTVAMYVTNRECRPAGRLHPDFGDAIDGAPGDVPVFWACGVTIQAALMASRPLFAITHAPGHMFITDVPDTDSR
jgi:uncharacterized protein YcsI (UPF0317 family)